MPRKPGAQPNNRNAYKHGFYSRFFTAMEGRSLSKIPLTDMVGEIGLLRVNVERFMQAYLTSLDDLDYDSRLSGLRAITLAVGRIAALQRIASASAKNFAEVEKMRQALDDTFDKISSEPSSDPPDEITCDPSSGPPEVDLPGPES